MLALALAAPAGRAPPPAGDALSPAGEWRAALDLAGGELRFVVKLERRGSGWGGELCNGTNCLAFSGVSLAGDSVVLEMADYAAAIGAKLAGDSLTGAYRNI